MTRHRTVVLVLAAVLFLASGCATVGPGSESGSTSGGGSQPGGPSPTAAGVTVSPATVSVHAAETQQFSATLQGSGATAGGFSWSVNGVAGGDSVVGTISSSGLYTAPGLLPNPNTVTIRATSNADPNRFGTSVTTLLNPIPLLTDVNPRTMGTGLVTLHVTGGRYLSGATINFGGTSLPATLVSSSHLRATFTIPDSQTSTVSDAQNNLIPTYDQPVVESNACALTGWTYAKETASTRDWPRPAYYRGQLQPVDSHHDTNAKVLVDGAAVPTGGTASHDLKLALDALFRHPNVAPFVSRLLIQQLVTSNPSPAYVQRVATAFSTGRSGVFGSGQPGNMQAIIAAILLDPEARRGDTALPGDPAVKDDGKIKEPILLMLNLLCATGATSDGDALIGPTAELGQNYLFPPTVFSYFPPDYQVPGMPLVAPELQLYNTSTAFTKLTSIDQYGATLASWFGVPASDLPAVFGNLPNFTAQNPGFMA